jgi:acetylornithine deacetylase/succinyl-diaminopimelate desuccinylase-like protein
MQMTEMTNSAIQYAHQNRQRFLGELNELLRIPSVSTLPEHAGDVRRAAEWVAAKLSKIGLSEVQVLDTAGHPVVYAAYKTAGQAAPTVLVYGHYDVQPAEPLELWESGAFEPSVRGENLYARGASDMKGQVMASIAAIESIHETGQLPVNLVFLIEGEEEIGSPNLGDFIRDHKQQLESDFALNPDSGILAPDIPSITYALRGLAYFELRVSGPDHDLHSGLFGGIVHNPAQALCELGAGMHDAEGRITLPGFYDKVRPLDAEERAELARLPVNESTYKQQTGVQKLWGEAGYTAVERLGARPTLEVNGLLSGFTGEGSKTVLPSKAMAKISCRLVPDQDPEEVYQQMLKYLEANAPDTIQYELIKLAGGPASISDRNSLNVEAMAKAMEVVWGKRPVFRREGGSVPVVAQFQQILGIETLNAGFGLPDDNFQAPNEKLHLPTWERGIDALIHFFYNLV